jgi:CheY-like chemotaxis protein
VLIVDDYGRIPDAYRSALAAEHELVVAPSAEAALEILRERPTFDVILCDLDLREMTGMELYDTVMQDDPEKAARFVFMTRDADRPAHCLFLARVPNVFLEAPISLAIVRLVIDERVHRFTAAQSG